MESHELPIATYDAMEEACRLMESSQKKDDWMKALEILVKLLGIGSNFFNSK